MTVKPGWARKRPTEARKLPSRTEKPRAEPVSELRSIWKLSHDEQRILIVTFVGGLGSIIVAACIIGGAIAFARTQRAAGLNWWIGFTGFWLVMGVVWLVVVRELRRPDNTSGRVDAGFRAAARVGLAVWCAVAAITLMVWIGVAAGIH